MILLHRNEGQPLHGPLLPPPNQVPRQNLLAVAKTVPWLPDVRQNLVSAGLVLLIHDSEGSRIWDTWVPLVSCGRHMYSSHQKLCRSIAQSKMSCMVG